MGRFFGLIPAAGKSHRMGKHKLLLPWKDARVFDAVLSAWIESRVSHSIVVVRSDDEALLDAIGEVCGSSNPSITTHVIEHETADMKSTIQVGLRFIEREWNPTEEDGCLISPADLPRISSRLINRVIESVSDVARIVVPYYGDKRGHPVLFPWPQTKAIHDLASDEGLDAMLDRSEVYRLNLDPDDRLRDIDTPGDFARELELDD